MLPTLRPPGPERPRVRSDCLLEQVGFEIATPRSILREKLSAQLAEHSSQDRGSSAGENLIAKNSPHISALCLLNKSLYSAACPKENLAMVGKCLTFLPFPRVLRLDFVR
jgi:hypothetical protein